MPQKPERSPLEGLLPKIRSRFPLIDRDAQHNSRIYLNSAAGSLMVDSAIEAAAAAGRSLNPMPGAVCPGEIETARFHERVRTITADFLNARGPREISFHASTTAALFNLAFAMQEVAGPQDNVLVTDLDHMANVSPWETVLGKGAGCAVRRVRVTDEGTLDLDHLFGLVDERSRVLAVTMASNALGTIVPLAETIGAVRRMAPGCCVVVDAVHHALHGPIDVQDIDCDFLAFSGYKVFGPMLGVLWGKEERLEGLQPYHVETNKSEPPGRFEQGMLNNAALASLAAALEYILWLGAESAERGRTSPRRREQFAAAMNAIAVHEETISRRVLEGLKTLNPDVFTLFGLTDPARRGERDPTFAFEVAGQSAAETKKLLWDNSGIQIADGNHYSAAVYRHLRKPALCRASFAHYDSVETAGKFLAALEGITRKRAR